MITKRSITILILYVAFLIPATAQMNKDTSGISGPFREKLMLQTDRNLYIHGDSVWFAAQYFLNGQVQSRQISNIMYLELLNDAFEPLVRKKFRISNGRADGAFKIPDEAYTGNYLVRVYTQYQRNLKIPGFAYHPIAVVNPQMAPSGKGPEAGQAVRIIPEGGSLVHGIKSRVGIFLNDSLAQIAGSIQVVDQTDSILARLHPAPNGIHSVEITPSDTANYYLRITGANTDTMRKAFPVSKPCGLVTKITRANGRAVYSLEQRRKDSDFRHDYTLEVYSDNLRKVKKLSLEDPDRKEEVALEEDELPRGMAYFVLRDNSGKVIRVQSFFSGLSEAGRLGLETDRQVYAPREPIRLAITPPAASGRPVTASVSVVRKGTLPQGDSLIPRHVFMNPALLEHRLMTTGLTPSKHLSQMADGLLLYDRHINNPTFYATLDHPQRDDMTYLPEIRDVSVSGMLRHRETKEPVSGHKVYASLLFKGQRLHIDRTNEQGRFIFSLYGLEGLNDLYLCPENRRNEEHELLVNNKFSHVKPDFSPGALNVDSAVVPLIREMMIDQQLSGIGEEEENKKEDAGAGDSLGQPAYFEEAETVYMSDYVDFEKTETVFREIVSDVYIRRQEDRYRFKIERSDGVFLPGDPLILFDNIPVFEPDKILQVQPAQIESIQVIPRSYILGDHTLNGVIIINSTTDNFADLDFPRGSTFLQYQGVSDAGAFKAKTCRDTTERSRRRPDFRTTLYWNPNLTITGQGQSVSFFASDRKGDYEIVVRGFSEDGSYHYSRKTITVK